MELVWKQPLVPALTWEYGGTPTNTGTAERLDGIGPTVIIPLAQERQRDPFTMKTFVISVFFDRFISCLTSVVSLCYNLERLGHR